MPTPARLLRTLATMGVLAALPGAWPTATAAANDDAAKTEAEAPGATMKVRLAPAPGQDLIYSVNIQSQSQVRKADEENVVKMVDVLTNVFELRTRDETFTGGAEASVALVNSEAQAFSQTMQPIPRPSPLQPLVGGTAQVWVEPNGQVKLRKVEHESPLTPMQREAFRKLAADMLVPFAPPAKPLKIGDEFEVERREQMPLQNSTVDVEILEKYTVTAIEPPRAVFRVDTIVRPASRTQQQQVFGRGEGRAAYDGNLGLIYYSEDRRITEGRLKGNQGWVVFNAETNTTRQIQGMAD